MRAAAPHSDALTHLSNKSQLLCVFISRSPSALHENQPGESVLSSTWFTFILQLPDLEGYNKAGRHEVSDCLSTLQKAVWKVERCSGAFRAFVVASRYDRQSKVRLKSQARIDTSEIHPSPELNPRGITSIGTILG